MTKGHGSVQEFGLSERRGQAVSRRRFLSASALAGASLGAVACTHPVAAKPVTTPTLASGRVWPSPPAGPAPRWTAAIADYDTGGSSGLGLASLGGTIVAWYGTKAWGFNAATGFVAWTQSVGA